MGVWIEARETTLDIKSATESLNTMTLRYGIRNTEIHHLRIWTGSGPADAKRYPPQVSVRDLPPNHAWQYDVYDETTRRYYDVRFSPPLRAARRPLFIEVAIREPTSGQYYMFQDEIPRRKRNEFLDAGCDYFKQRILLSTRVALLRVIFPLGFVPTGISYFQARVAETETPIPSEQRRLRKAVSVSRNDQDRRVLSATIKRPLLGATYVLLWRPPERPSGGKPGPDAANSSFDNAQGGTPS